MSGKKLAKKIRTEEETAGRRGEARITAARIKELRESVRAASFARAKRRYDFKYIPNYFFLVFCLLLILFFCGQEIISGIKFFTAVISIVFFLLLLWIHYLGRVRGYEKDSISSYDNAVYGIQIIIYTASAYTVIATSILIIFA
ncbi:MAG: hypothetical protein ACD_14C00032G0008 [uncultured bacterium]|nr:MAG: hypothetical protein ACD_14C00032G0008 [uncultured bacterium]